MERQYAFHSVTLPLASALRSPDFRFGHATHGYLPEKGPRPVFCAKGPHIRAGAVVEGGSIVNEAPTYAKLLGVDLPDAQGTPLDVLE